MLSAFLSHFSKIIFGKWLFRQFQRFALLECTWMGRPLRCATGWYGKRVSSGRFDCRGRVWGRSVMGCSAASMERASGRSRSNPIRYLDTRWTLIWDRRWTPRAHIGTYSSNPKIHVPIITRSLAWNRHKIQEVQKISCLRYPPRAHPGGRAGWRPGVDTYTTSGQPWEIFRMGANTAIQIR